MPREVELARIEVERVERATEKALLVVTDTGAKAWIAKSTIHEDSEVFDAEENTKGTLVIPEWLATEKGLT